MLSGFLVTMPLRVLGRQTEHIRSVGVNTAKKESRRADKGCFNVRVDETLAYNNIIK